jgi:hypothetical protein
VGDPAPQAKVPTAPELPKDAPADLRDFISCTAAKLELKEGKLDWLPLPISPSSKFAQPAGKPGRIDVTLSFGEYSPSATLPVTISGGKLDVDTSGWPDLLPGKDGVTGWVRQLNDWFASNGKQLGAPVLKGGKLTLVKEALAAAPAQKAVKAVPLPARVGVGLLVLGGAVGIGVVATRGDGHRAVSAPATAVVTTPAPSTTPATPPPSTASATLPPTTPTTSPSTMPATTPAPTLAPTTVSSDVPTLAPPSTVLPIAPMVFSGCIGLEHGTGQSWITPSAVLEHPISGTYTISFATGPTGAVTSTAQLSGDVLSGRITITKYGVYDGLTITGPGGVPIAVGPLGASMPFRVTATPVACDASTLPRPAVPASTEPPPPTSSGSPTTANADQAVKDFVVQLVHELDLGDTSDAVAQLDPLVIERYGAAQCTSHLEAQHAATTSSGAAPARSVTFVDVTGPASWDYASDGLTTTVDDVDTLHVLIGTAASTIHVHVPAGSSPTWFTDCGAPG